MPRITQTAIGRLPYLPIRGTDYDTHDGTGVRDYIHVSDIAHAHTLALNYLIDEKNSSNCDVFNLGSGNGYTVLEVIKTFEKISDQKLNYAIGPRRQGDVIAIFANNEKARTLLGWIPEYTLEEMMLTAWNWQLKLNRDENLFSSKNATLN